jgi:DNA-binding transcriptional regulator YhcF (GntR family)
MPGSLLESTGGSIFPSAEGPVRIEDCGDLPPTLASLLWEDFSNQPYESALKRVLDSIFDVDSRPPLGKPPAYVQADVLPTAGLAPKDRLIFEALCRNTIATGFALIDDINSVVEELKEQGISEQQIVETQDLLEELGYVRLHRVAGPAHAYCQTVTLTGFDTFADANVSGFQSLIDTVRQRVLQQGDQLENAELAKALGQPLRIVSHILEVMENRGWITLTRESGGGYESLRVDLVSPSLKRM